MAQVTYKQIAKVVADQMQTSDAAKVARGLAAYLVEERKANELDRIMREVERIRLVESGILEVDVESAHELTSEIRSQIEAIFSENKVRISSNINKSLVGGVKIQAQDTLIDLSVRGQLNRLKTHNF